MQVTARMASVVSSTLPSLRRLIRGVAQETENMSRSIILTTLGATLVSCQVEHSSSARWLTLKDLYAQNSPFASSYGARPTTLELFSCSRLELQSLTASDVFISRIGEGILEASEKPERVRATDDGALMGRLTDYDSYLEPTCCDFDPVIRLSAESSAGRVTFDVCFACSDIQIRLPSGRRRMVHMGRELRRAILEQTELHYPHDPVLRRLYHR
jgi:hypothetical protein